MDDQTNAQVKHHSITQSLHLAAYSQKKSGLFGQLFLQNNRPFSSSFFAMQTLDNIDADLRVGIFFGRLNHRFSQPTTGFISVNLSESCPRVFSSTAVCADE